MTTPERDFAVSRANAEPVDSEERRVWRGMGYGMERSRSWTVTIEIEGLSTEEAQELASAARVSITRTVKP